MTEQTITSDRAGELAQQLVGQSVTRAQRGHGSALLLEIGELQPQGAGRYPAGQYGIMLEWSWRIENENSIVIGSWSDAALIEQAPALFEGRTIEAIAFTGRIKELYVTLSDNLWLASFMTAEGIPEWALKCGQERWLHHNGNAFIVEG